MQAAEGGVGGGDRMFTVLETEWEAEGVWAGWGLVLMVTEFQLGKMETFWRRGVGGAGGAAQYTDCRPPGHLAVVKMATLTL